MCGILGIKDFNKLTKSSLSNLIEGNRGRGKISLSKFTTPSGTFFHFRAPTSGCSLHNLSEAYPLTYKGWGLIGNGIIKEHYFNKIKDEENNNDLYYILKNIVEYGFKSLKEVEGCFSLSIFSPNGEIFIVKNTFPLYYNENVFSSIEFENSKLLDDGVVLNWMTNNIYEEIELKEQPYLF